jgi:hypothetical protein
MNLPSIKTLAEVFGDRAKEARAILEMDRAQLLDLPAGRARARECYNPPSTLDLIMTCLNALDCGTYGVEAFRTRRGRWCEYLNTGDTYAPTLMHYRNRFRVASWGDIAERYGTREG